jgi:hypothetical protein
MIFLHIGFIVEHIGFIEKLNNQYISHDIKDFIKSDVRSH